MPTWKLTLEYDGTRYHGWQSQKNADRTIQGVLARAARELLGEDAAIGARAAPTPASMRWPRSRI